MEEPVDLAEEELELEETEEPEEVSDSEVSEEEDEELEEELGEEEEFVEAEEKVSRKEKEETEEDIVEERFYTIPLGKAWISPRKKRAPKAVRIVKSFVLKHMKVRTEAEGEEEPERLVIDNEVNEKLWERSIEKPPRNIRVRVVKDKEGVVTVLLAEGD
ncbi:MAG TPA: 50S ribosomal protein L31e [Candidatus Bathyarchaeota archaeon]|nr:50S ribosomal protein L31e [Candidatus Bathyarchaeota archaeon]